MAIPQRISIVTLGVSNLPASVAFYEALGWEQASASTEEIAWFKTSDSVLGLFPVEELAKDADVAIPAYRQFRGVTLAINVESEALVDTCMAEARGAGATITRPAERVEWGGYRGYFADPDGHSWEVAFNPFFPIQDSGQILID